MGGDYSVSILQIRCPRCGIAPAQQQQITRDLQKIWRDDPRMLQIFLAHLRCHFRREWEENLRD